MRSLPSVVDAQDVIPVIELTLITSVGSSYTFGNDDIVTMQDHRSRMKLGGGLGKPSNYTVDLKWSLAEQKLALKDLPLSQTRLKVTANSDTFHPHFGRVISYDRNKTNPDLIQLAITDPLFFDTPKFPVASIVDSWNGAHAVEISADAGEPFYYGDESKRGIYFTAVDSVISKYIGPKNVSSAAREEVVYFNTKPSEPTSLEQNLLTTGYYWNQQSGGDNLATDVISEWLIRDNPVKGFTGVELTVASNGLFMWGNNDPVAPSPPILYLSRGTTGWQTVDLPNSLNFNYSNFIHTGSSYLLVGHTKGADPVFMQVLSSNDPYDFSGSPVNVLSAVQGAYLDLIRYYEPYFLASASGSQLGVSTNGLDFTYFPTSVSMASGGVGRMGDALYDQSCGFFFVEGSSFFGAETGLIATKVSTDIVNWNDCTETFSVTPRLVQGTTSGGFWKIVGVSDNTIAVSTDSLNFNTTLTSSLRITNPIWSGSEFMVSRFTGPEQYIGRSGDGDSWVWDNVSDIVDAVYSFLQGPNGTFIGVAQINAFLPERKAMQTGPLFLADYQKDSVFIGKSATSRIAISENPIKILDDIFSHYLSFPYVQLQSSATQTSVDNFKFNCYFAAREPIADIIDDFCKTAAVNAWVGDSGMINYRTYAESASATVDRTVPEGDMLNFRIQDNPIGSPVTNEKLASKFSFAYRYDFQRREYTGALAMNAGNNSMCDSLQAIGVKQNQEHRSKYIMDSDVASLWSISRTRIEARTSALLAFDLPAQYFGVELGDVLKVQQRMIVGSETLGQVVDLRTDYRRGKVQVKLEELKAYEA